MKTATIAAILLIVIVTVSTGVIGFTQNWFQANPTPTPTASPTQNPTPTATTEPTATTKPTTKPTATAHPTAVPTTQPTTVDEMDLTLEIYGNANMDDKVDSSDVTYLQQIIGGSKTVTQFADTNMDGTVDANDVTQLNALLDRTADKIYLVDGNGKNVSVSIPATRVVVEYNQNTELMRILEIEDLVVGVDSGVEPVKQLFFPDTYQSIVSVGGMSNPDYEVILNLNPTTILTFSPGSASSASPYEKAAHLPGIDVIYLGLYSQNVTNPEDSRFIQGVLKAGYIFDKVDRATEYANWILDLTSTIKDKVNTIPEADRQTALITNSPTIGSAKAYLARDTLGQALILAGGSNIAPTPEGSTALSVVLDTEEVIEQDPDFIFLHTVRYTYGGGTNDPAQGIDANDPTGMQTVLQDYVSQAAYVDLTAVTSNHVYMIAGDFRNNAMGGTLGAVYMAKILYPTVFSDYNPQTIHQYYITHFLGLSNYNLDTNGVWLYPALNINGDTVGYPNGAL
jgi:iron complex transport system substrate-binding protein